MTLSLNVAIKLIEDSPLSFSCSLSNCFLQNNQ